MSDYPYKKQKTYTVEQARQALENYCGYQDRCHEEVMSKLRSMSMIPEAVESIIEHLINSGFLNEERFARSFARGKHRVKSWGKVRITNELKARNISKRNIETALKEISSEEYYDTFYRISERLWETLPARKSQATRKKFCDALLRKGFESNLVYDRLKELEKA